MRTGLMLHCGSQLATVDQVANVATPAATSTHFPVPHIQLAEQIFSTLAGLGIGVRESAMALSPDRARCFGLMTLAGEYHLPQPGSNYGVLLGWRNSHNKEWAAGLAAGQHVFVCDNLSFSGEFKVQRKHTRWIGRDLPGLVGRAMDKILAKAAEDAYRIARWQKAFISDTQAEALILRAALMGAIPVRDTIAVRAEYMVPRHEEFSPRTAWSLYNAFTECLKPRQVVEEGQEKPVAVNIGRLWARSPRLVPLIEKEVAVA